MLIFEYQQYYFDVAWITNNYITQMWLAIQYVKPMMDCTARWNEEIEKMMCAQLMILLIFIKFVGWVFVSCG